MSHMNLSQALRRIDRLKGKMAELTARAEMCVSFADVEGRRTEFDFETVMTELALTREQLVTLDSAKVRANARGTVTHNGNKMSISEAIRRLQENKGEQTFYARLHLRYGVEKEPVQRWDSTRERHIMDSVDVTWKSGLTETQRSEKLNALRDEFETLNAVVESANHTTKVEWLDPASSGGKVTKK